VPSPEPSADEEAQTRTSATEAPQKSMTILHEIERDFGEFARSVGYQGDVGPLWEEAQAQAEALAKPSSQQRQAQVPATPQTPQRITPVAADIQLRPGGGIGPDGFYISPPRRGVQPRSPPSASGSYPASPGRGDEWLTDTYGPRQEREPEALGPDALEPSGTQRQPSSGEREWEEAAETSPAARSRGSGPLPAAAQESFQQAEALCQRQRFAEAIPLFRQTLELLEEGGLAASTPGSPAAAVAAEVWAHLGVAMQSLDRVPESIDGYRRAVTLDPSLHVCFANLATLHAYLNERERAVEYITRALTLDPHNPTYAQLRSQFTSEGKGDAASEATSSPESNGDGSADEEL